MLTFEAAFDNPHSHLKKTSYVLIRTYTVPTETLVQQLLTTTILQRHKANLHMH